MADTIKSSTELNLTMVFEDDDTRVLSLPNPKDSVNKSNVKDLESVMQVNQPLVSDKSGAPFTNFKKAVVHTVESRQFDLE